MPRYLNRGQTMQALGIGPHKLRKLWEIEKRLTPPIRLTANMTGRYFLADEVEALAEQLTTERAQATMRVHAGRRGSPVRGR